MRHAAPMWCRTSPPLRGSTGSRPDRWFRPRLWRGCTTGYGLASLREAGLRPHCRPLRNLGHAVSRSTVANILREAGLEPAPEGGRGGCWKAFLKAHWDGLGRTPRHRLHHRRGLDLPGPAHLPCARGHAPQVQRGGDRRGHRTSRRDLGHPDGQEPQRGGRIPRRGHPSAGRSRHQVPSPARVPRRTQAERGLPSSHRAAPTSTPTSSASCVRSRRSASAAWSSSASARCVTPFRNMSNRSAQVLCPSACESSEFDSIVGNPRLCGPPRAGARPRFHPSKLHFTVHPTVRPTRPSFWTLRAPDSILRSTVSRKKSMSTISSASGRGTVRPYHSSVLDEHLLVHCTS